MTSLNLGILAHVDAGKTSLTERLLFEAGVIDEVGSVDDGSTQTDSLALEQQRGITIRSAVVSFTIGETVINLVDTPGHSDFIAEVERALSVLDGAILVISAVEGVQAQTRVLMRALQRLGIPTLIFVNKIDRTGARPDEVVREITERLTPRAIALGSVRDAGGRDASFVPYECGSRPMDAWVDLLSAHDGELLAAYVEDPASVTESLLQERLAEQSRAGTVHPVAFGSAVTGAGVEALMCSIPRLLPVADPDVSGPPRGTVFKVERGGGGEQIAYLRLESGTVRVRDRLRLVSPAERRVMEAKVTAIREFDSGVARPAQCARAGRIAQVWGLAGVRIGDEIGDVPTRSADRHFFSPPSLETVVDPVRDADRGTMHVGLSQLAEQDPLIDLRQDDVRHEISVSLYGEVQKEVIQAMLAQEYDVDVTFRETTTICIERPSGSGEAFEIINVGPNPFLATVGLRVDPAPVGSGITFALGVELGSMPPAFFTAVEEAVHATLREGLRGWAVADCLVTMTHSGYWARQSHSHGTFDASMSSTAGDFRNLTPMVLTDALRRAGTCVHEPIHHFELEVPEDALGATLSALSHVRGVPLDTQSRGAAYVLAGDIPAATVHQLQQRVPGLTRGEGVLVTAFDRYEPVQGATPERSRIHADPADRRAYLQALGR
ncbi:elongation factor G [Luteipulveratus mongoliensis]|uniref:GTP-binding protein n=1 Tax=Luteipulveratus mongoliensis TaxID=571913 RepID=A0A0K1JD98_9MICO|nr:TetM/TetW/TetO/TetS family tetracycline resistance ribosomal protection protein [Luteipulveratus mongoliensis]AKU14687.1 GTP-binding protein [Luteipulveratus mongoliensis]